MKRITLILKTSEVMSVRKAVRVAGANRIEVQPSHRECGGDPNTIVSAEDELLQLELMVREKYDIKYALSRHTRQGLQRCDDLRFENRHRAISRLLARPCRLLLLPRGAR